MAAFTLRGGAKPGPINTTSAQPTTPGPFSGAASSRKGVESSLRTSETKTDSDCLHDILSNFSFIDRPQPGAKIPEGWTFHLQCSQPRPHQGQSQSKRSDPKEQGYFHHAASRITTNIDVTCQEVDLSEANKSDEFAEVVLISRSAYTANKSPNTATSYPGSDSKSHYVRFHIDHFNRTFGTDASCLRSPATHQSHIHPTEGVNHEKAYMEWIALIGYHLDSHLYMPSAKPKEYSCLGRKIAQQVVWDHQNGHITKIDIENAFSPMECTSLLSALQKKRVTDKQCQKIIRTVIERFLSARQFKQPLIEPSLKASDEEGERGRVVVFVSFIAFIIWIGPMLSVPAAYFRRLRTIAARADGGAYLPHLWRTFIKVLLKEWTDLSIVLALVLAANVAFLALPGTSERPESEPVGTYSATLADVSRGAGIVSMFVTLGGLLTTLCLIWLHQPMQGTGSSDACKYLLGAAYVQEDRESQSYKKPAQGFTFLRLILMATYLGMPLVLLLWSVIAFVISAVTWTFLFSTRATQITVVTICGLVLMTPMLTILVFWGPIISKDSLLSKAARGGSDPPQ